MARRLTADQRRAIQAFTNPDNLRRAIQTFASPDNLRRAIQGFVEDIRAAKHPTAADLMRGIQIEIEASRARRFAALSQPYVFERPAGLTQRAAKWAAFKPGNKHRAAMMRLLREQFGLPPAGSLSERQLVVLLAAVLKTYVPAFGEVKLAPAKRAQGRPASSLTAQEKADIGNAVMAGHSVRWACMRLAHGDKKKAEALAAAWRRATKP